VKHPVIDPEKDYYGVLEIPIDADEERIKRAYRQQARRHHPDSGSGDVAAFRLVQEAYDILRDTVLRQAYDRQRTARGLTERGPLQWTFTLSRLHLEALDSPQLLYVLIDIRASKEKEPQASRLPLNLALVIDRSNSMRGVRMENVKLAALDMLEYLAPQDRLAVVAFSDRAEVFAPSTLATDRATLRSAITALTPGGGTEINQGLLKGLDEIRNHHSPNHISHIFLLTDGRTYGDEEKVLDVAEEAYTQGIGISALGIGEDWNDLLLDEAARRGGGFCKYIESPSQVRQILRDHIHGLSDVVAQDLSLSVQLADDSRIQSFHRIMPHMEHLGAHTARPYLLGPLQAEKGLSLLMELIVKQAEPGWKRVARFDLSSKLLKTAQPLQLHRDVELRFVRELDEQPQVSSRLLNYLSRLSIFRLQERAWLALEAGETNQATSLLQAAATRLFDMGYRDLAQAAMLEAGRVSQGGPPTMLGRKKLRYGTRSLTLPTK